MSFQTSANLVGRDHNSGWMSTCGRSARAAGRGRRTSSRSPRRGAGSLGGDNENGGLTAFAASDGIVCVRQPSTRPGSTLFYRNNNSGNIDDLAVAGKDQGGGRPPRGKTAALEADRALSEVATSARGNWVAFTSTSQDFPFDRNGQSATCSSST